MLQLFVGTKLEYPDALGKTQALFLVQQCLQLLGCKKTTLVLVIKEYTSMPAKLYLRMQFYDTRRDVALAFGFWVAGRYNNN